jgi:hypothetical protein
MILYNKRQIGRQTDRYLDRSYKMNIININCKFRRTKIIIIDVNGSPLYFCDY